MAYKRNPVKCERVCSLARYLMADALNAPMTASVQWMERTLDDSANRRISIPEGFLCADSIMKLLLYIVPGLRVNEKVIEKNVMEYLPFIATENVLMAAVKKGGDRQELHEVIRVLSMQATQRMKNGEEGGLVDLMANEPKLPVTKEDLLKVLDPSLYIGRCPSQVTNYVQKLQPLLQGAKKPEKEMIL